VFVLGLLGFLLCVLCFLWRVLCVFVENAGFWVVNMGQGKKAFSIGKRTCAKLVFGVIFWLK
jgi:hypothetical protein